MKQSAEQRPIPSVQRKAAIALGAALDHSGHVDVAPIPDFDLDKTIFQTLEGAIPRHVIRTRIAKAVQWDRYHVERRLLVWLRRDIHTSLLGKLLIALSDYAEYDPALYAIMNVWAEAPPDTLVLPDVQRGYVQRACAAGATLEYREYPGEDHLSLVKADGAYARDLLAWTQARFAGTPARGCR